MKGVNGRCVVVDVGPKQHLAKGVVLLLFY